jgi:hypothetical protein
MLLLAMFLAHDNELLELRVRSKRERTRAHFFFGFFAFSPQKKRTKKSKKNARQIEKVSPQKK